MRLNTQSKQKYSPYVKPIPITTHYDNYAAPSLLITQDFKFYFSVDICPG